MMSTLFAYAEETRRMIVRVSVTFMAEQSEPERSRWFWAYHIRVENQSDMAAQLISRKWKIRDARGTVHNVEGEGVVGEQPVIKPGKSYDYVSGCPLTTPSGSMAGSFMMAGEDGSMFQIAIPHFDLSAPVTAR